MSDHDGPIRLNQFVEDVGEDVEEAVQEKRELANSHLCNNCYHQQVCSVALAIKVVTPGPADIAIGLCVFHLPVQEGPDALPG